MTYDLALYPASGPGLGHLMRCYALAEAAVEMGKKVVVGLTAPGGSDLGWPCAVALAGHGQTLEIHTTVAITDGWVPKNQGKFWTIIDAPPTDHSETVCGYIYPHFGATPIPGYPTLYGEQWMPLRKQFREGQSNGLGLGVYRVPQNVVAAEPGSFTLSGDTYAALLQCTRVIVPPSTIAYEALALGLRVELAYDEDQYDSETLACLDSISKAMVVAGAATMWSDSDHRPLVHHYPSDGRGAKRILEALL